MIIHICISIPIHIHIHIDIDIHIHIHVHTVLDGGSPTALILECERLVEHCRNGTV